MLNEFSLRMSVLLVLEHRRIQRLFSTVVMNVDPVHGETLESSPPVFPVHQSVLEAFVFVLVGWHPPALAAEAKLGRVALCQQEDDFCVLKAPLMAVKMMTTTRMIQTSNVVSE